MESIEKNNNKLGPCLEKKCSFCCNPVKVGIFFPEDKIPIDENGEKIWKERKGILIPEDEIDRTKLKSYDCKKFDKKQGKCSDYEKRPVICKRSSCIDQKSKDSIDKQHEKTINRKFITIKT